MISLPEMISIATFIVLIAGIVGGYFGLRTALRTALVKSEAEVQTRVRDALSAENSLLQSRVNRLERENKRLSKLLQLIVLTLRKTHSIELDVDEDVVILRDSGGTHTARLDTPEVV